MAHSNYLLQYHLYCLALNRFLSRTGGDGYSYDENFGGAYYLFIRGMHRPNFQDDGIFFDRPSGKLIESMDRYFSLERSSSQ